MVLNEPETSLHSDLLAPLARLITQVSKRSQIIVVSHAQPLVDALSKSEDARIFRLQKTLGETIAAGVEAPAWSWPKR
jgi:predicted ATPase